LEESLTRFRRLAETWGISICLDTLGGLALRGGDDERARAIYVEALELSQRLGHVGSIAAALRNLGWIACRQGEEEKAVSLLQEGLRLERKLGARQGIVECLEALAEVAGGRRQRPAVEAWATAARLLGAAAALREALGTDIQPGDRPDYERRVEAVRIALGKEAFAVAWTAGRAMTPEQTVEDALGSEET
jgi:hypothetical protein